MQSREQTFFLSVLADHLNGRETTPVADLDWEMVYDLASRHCVSALFYAQCGAFLPSGIELQFLQDYGTTVADYAARQKIVSDLDREFTLHQIPYVLVKGITVAESYPQPELRTMGDIDVIVKTEDKSKAHTVLLQLGFHNTQQQDHEWVYWKDSCELELHHRLLYEQNINAPAALRLADRMWEFVQVIPGSSRCELFPEFHFLFLVMHLKKHVAARGAGFRQFMDLAAAVRKWSLDWSQLNAWLADADLHSFAEGCLTLCQTWFQLSLPLAGAELSPAFEQEILQQIFSNGVFGYENKANRRNFFIAKIYAAGGDGVGRMLRMSKEELMQLPEGWSKKKWSILFPNYEFLRKTQNYGFINRRPWLLPIAWSYRFIHCFWYKITQIWQILQLHCNTIRNRNKNLKKPGLPYSRRSDEYDHN